jgi:hypothetical protein
VSPSRRSPVELQRFIAADQVGDKPDGEPGNGHAGLLVSSGGAASLSRAEE